MVVKTREFGPVTIGEEDIIQMESPVYGYEDMKRFVLLADEEIGEGLEWFQSVDDEQLCFILVDPYYFGLVYNPQIPCEVTKLLGLTEENTAIRLIAVIPEGDFLKTRVNLRCPLVINVASKKAAQAVLEAEYPIRYDLFIEGEGKGE